MLIDGEGALAQRFEEDGRAVPLFATRTAAVEFAENQLIASYGDELCQPATVDVADSPALSPLAAEDAAALAALMEEHSYDDGDVIRRIRQRFGGVYFILSGSVVTTSPGPENSRVKLSTLSAGMTFGEMALGGADRQETTVRAHGTVRVKLLPGRSDQPAGERKPAPRRRAVESTDPRRIRPRGPLHARDRRAHPRLKLEGVLRVAALLDGDPTLFGE